MGAPPQLHSLSSFSGIGCSAGRVGVCLAQWQKLNTPKKKSKCKSKMNEYIPVVSQSIILCKNWFEAVNTGLWPVLTVLKNHNLTGFLLEII